MNAATPLRPPFARHRRSDFDVTNAVQVSSTEAVTRAVAELFAAEWPGLPFEPIATALQTFLRAVYREVRAGQAAGLTACPPTRLATLVRR